MNPFILTGFSDEIHEDFIIQLESMKKLNINYIEIRGVNGKNITSITTEEAQELKKQLDFSNIKISAIGSPIGKVFINEPFDKHLELFKHTLNLAKIFQTQYIRIFSFYIPDGKYHYYRNEVINRLKCFTKLAETEGIILLHENEKDIYGDTPERCLDIINSINSPNLKVTFDFANFVQCGINPLDAYSQLKSYIHYIHVKDCIKDTLQIVPAGVGDGHLKEILADLIKEGYHGFVSLEPHLGFFKGLEDLQLELNIEKFEENGFEKFKIAYEAFTKLLKDILKSEEE